MKPFKGLKAYDNGGDTVDRYSVIWYEPDAWYGREDAIGTLDMSDSPTHPQGVSMMGLIPVSDFTDEHIGKQMPFSDLPEHIQAHVKDRLEP